MILYITDIFSGYDVSLPLYLTLYDMVDFNKILEQEKAKGKFIGYCNKCDTASRLFEIDILPAYKDALDDEKKAKCPRCNYYQLVKDLIPF